MPGLNVLARKSFHAVIALLLLLTLLLSALPVGAQSGFEVVAAGLNNPRGLSFGPEGALYVTEAGTGGTDCFFPDPNDPTFELCAGGTGSVTRIMNGSQTQVATGLASLADPSGFAATGPTDISFQGRGGAYITVGLGNDPAVRDTLAQTVNPFFANFGQLVQMPASGKWKNFVDISAYEGMANPDGAQVDSNPYAALALPNHRVVADAGGNSLLHVKANGNISTLATFPQHLWVVPDGLPFPIPPGTVLPVDAVPTSVVKGPDGAYYVGELASVAAGDANVYRVPAGGGTPEVYEGGFTAIIDIAFAPDGSLYVLEIFKNGLLAGEFFGDFEGALIHVALDGTRTEIASGMLMAPGGLALGPDGAIYVSNFSIFPGGGEVVRIDPDALASASLAAKSASHAQANGKIARLFGIDLSALRGATLDSHIFLPSIQR